MREKIRVVIAEPGKLAEVREIESTAEAMQAIVGGWLEVVPLGDPEDRLDCWLNEEGRLLGLPFNRNVPAPIGGFWDLHSTFFVCRNDGDGNCTGLSEEEARSVCRLLDECQGGNHVRTSTNHTR